LRALFVPVKSNDIYEYQGAVMSGALKVAVVCNELAAS
jgi:hypothetical protein